MVLRKCRPDWDISDPDLKVAWQRGDKSQFYPYGRSMAQVVSDQDK